MTHDDAMLAVDVLSNEDEAFLSELAKIPRHGIKRRYQELKSEGMSFVDAANQARAEWLVRFVAQCERADE